MTDPDNSEQNEPEERDPMSTSGYNGEVFVIPGLRLRKVSPSTRAPRHRDVDQVRRSTAAPPRVSKVFKSVTVDVGSGDAEAEKLRGFETKRPSSTPEPPLPSCAPETAAPIPGVLRGVQGAGNFGRRDTATDPVRRFFKGFSKGFRRSGDLDPGAGGV